MTDPRPRPQYGEYASPEDQAKAMGVPPADPSAQQQSVPQQPAPQQPAQRPALATLSAQPMLGHAAAVPETARRPRDIRFTILFLGLGVIWIVLTIPGMAALPQTIEQTYALQGYDGHYGPVALASALGLAINISQLVLWGLSCALSILAIRRRRRSFYIPLIGAVVAGIVSTVLVVVAMLNDPGLQAYLTGLSS